MKGPYHFLFKKFGGETPEQLIERAETSPPSIMRAMVGMQVLAFALVGTKTLYDIGRYEISEGTDLSIGRVVESGVEIPEAGVGLAAEWMALECLAVGMSIRRKENDFTDPAHPSQQ